MKAVYPIVLSKGREHIIVYIPDFGINTQGKNEAHAMEMARDAIGIMGIDMQDENETLPSPSTLANVQTENENDANIVTLVDVDFAEYRRKNDMRTVKKNCTIPSWLNFEAEKAGINFSAALQTALKRELRIKAEN